MMLNAAGRERVARIVGLWDDLVDPFVGIIQRVEETPVADDDPDLFHYYSKASDTARFSALSNFSENGGASTDRYVAVAKAMGEAIERYCSAIYDPYSLLFSAWRDLDVRAVDPQLLAMYRDDQFSWPGFHWQPFTADTPVHWTTGTSLVTDEPILLPAATVFIPFHYAGPTRSAFILQPISTGMACGATYDDAVLSGLCEVIERDAFTITWQACLSRPLIRHETLPPSCRDLVGRFAAAGIDVKLIDITNDLGVASVMSIALSDSPFSPAVSVAAATDPSPERAAIKSIEELAHTRKYAKQLMIYTPELPVDIENNHPLVRDQADHLRFYCPQSSRQFAEFAWSSSESRDLRDLPDLSGGSAERQIERVVRKCAAAALEPIAVELTSPDVAPLGLHAVHVVIPGAHPLQMGHLNRALGCRRLYEVPQRLGHRGLTMGEADNPYPHPFP